MNMNAGLFNETQHILIEFQLFVRMQASLQQNLGASQFKGFINLFLKLLIGNYRASSVFRPLVKGTELTGGNTDIGVIYIPVNDICNNRFRVFFPADTVGKKSKIIQVALAKQVQ